MSLDVKIKGGSGGDAADVSSHNGDKGLTVFTRSLYDPDPAFLPFINEENGNAMNVDASAGGTPVEIHDGEDNVYWTGNNVTGSTIDFNSTNRANSGAQSVRANSPSVGTIWEFDKGSDQSLSGYVSLSGAININRRWDVGDSVSVYGWRAGAQVGDKVLIEDYVNISDNDVWQNFVIPLSDMSLTGETVDTFRFQQEASSGSTGDWFLDDFQIEETGTPVEYRVTKSLDKDYEAYEFVISIVGGAAQTLANGAGQLPLTHNGILDLSELPIGITIRNIKKGETAFSANFKSIMDLMAVGYEITNSGSDASNAWVVLKQRFRSPLILQGSPEFNYLSVTINDNLSGLVRLNMALRGGQSEEYTP